MSSGVIQEFQGKLLSIQHKLLNYGYMLTANSDDAKDLLQETTLKALENRQKFMENTNFNAWVFTIMRNIFINNYRKQLHCRTIIDQTEDLYHLSLPQESGIETPDGACAIHEITHVINQFPDEYRTPFSMYVSGYKYYEIADKLDLPLGTVKSRIFFIRKRLQEILKDYAEDTVRECL